MSKFFIKYILIVTVFVTFFCDTTVFAKFDDISSHWAEETIFNFVEKGYLTSEDTKFMPDTEITKGELTTIVNHYFSYGNTEDELENIEIAVENGYLQNCERTEKITREEVAILVCKVLSLSPIDKDTKFLDNENISKWAQAYVSTIEENKIMIGYPDQTYKPKKYITKAEFVVVLNRCVGIGGVDLEIIETENKKIELGSLKSDEEGIKFVPLEEQILLKVGDNVQLAVKTLDEIEEKEIEFELNNKDVLKLDKETYILSALNKGKAEITVEIPDYCVKIEVIVE